MVGQDATGGAMSEASGKRVRIEVVDVMGSGRCSSGLHDVGQS